MKSPIAELQELDEILESLDRYARVQVLARVACGPHRFPIHAITLGPHDDRTSPALCIVGGVHGLERIGTQIILGHMRSLASYLRWDRHLPAMLEQMRLIFIPLLNPAGVYLHRRSNGHGVDLMRNAPVTAREPAPGYMLYRGHRLSNLLPWYRGAEHEGMELESQTLCDFVERELYPSKLALCLDVHSGFAGRDRIWFPYAGSRSLFPDVAEVMALKELFDETFPQHRYVIEPQALHYTAHGDLWDYIYDRHHVRKPGGLLLPLTLELASSSWLVKNPRQLFNPLGLFHPIKPHRVRRVLRRHWALLQFLTRAVLAGENWTDLDADSRRELEARALSFWSDAGVTPVATSRAELPIRHSEFPAPAE